MTFLIKGDTIIKANKVLNKSSDDKNAVDECGIWTTQKTAKATASDLYFFLHFHVSRVINVLSYFLN